MTALVVTAFILSLIWSVGNIWTVYANRALINSGLVRVNFLFLVPFLIALFTGVWLVFG